MSKLYGSTPYKYPADPDKHSQPSAWRCRQGISQHASMSHSGLEPGYLYGSIAREASTPHELGPREGAKDVRCAWMCVLLSVLDPLVLLCLAGSLRACHPPGHALSNVLP